MDERAENATQLANATERLAKAREIFAARTHLKDSLEGSSERRMFESVKHNVDELLNKVRQLQVQRDRMAKWPA